MCAMLDPHERIWWLRPDYTARFRESIPCETVAALIGAPVVNSLPDISGGGWLMGADGSLWHVDVLGDGVTSVKSVIRPAADRCSTAPLDIARGGSM